MNGSDDPIRGLVGSLLKELGEDPGRDGLERTPDRVARSMRYLTQGYALDPARTLNEARFDVSYDEMVLVKDIEFYSLCEHHLLPFFGRAHVAYVPDGHVVGLSKIPRLVEIFARRLQVQERMTTEIADTIDRVLAPKGVGVVLEARHLCMMMRGIQQQNNFAITSAMRGEFQQDPKTRAEFMNLIRHRTDGLP
ncbi:MAG: GTP cyclohydrolase I FolE [Deltaproteobacteria bacterium]|nr:MAG: GTP cyclohydrolase I FolE [Deltaproteobacteria bacterium]